MKDAPAEVLLAQGVSRRLRAAEWGYIRRIAREAGISPQAVFNIRDGASWGDLPTIARLEIVLDTNLWGREHRKGNPPPPRQP